MRRRAFLSSYRPLNQLRPGSSFRGSLSSSEFLRSNLPPTVFRRRAHLPRVSSLIAASSVRVHSHEGCQALASFRPQVFSTSRRFSPRPGFAGLFHPATTSRVVAVQGLLSPRSPSPSSGDASPLSLSSRPLPGVGPSGSAFASPYEIAKLRAREASTSRLYSARGSVAYGSGISLTAARSPLRFFLLQVVNHRLRLQFTQSHPPTTFVPFGSVLGVFAAAG
jgi:hypothetical protein